MLKNTARGASAHAKHLIPFSVRVRKAGRIQHFLILSATSAAALSCAMSVLPDGVAFAASVIRAGGAE